MMSLDTSFTSPSEIEGLTSLIQTGEVILFVGSGLSYGHYPSWKTLVEELCKKTNVSLGTDFGPTAEILMQYAEKAKISNSSKYNALLTQIFGGEPRDTPVIYSILPKVPWLCILTTNFDPILAKVIQLNDHGFSLEAYPHQNARILYRKKLVCYLHGIHNNFLPRGKSSILILSKSDFDEAYKEANLQAFLSTVFRDNHVIFCGCNLSEPEFEQIFKNIEKTDRSMKKLGREQKQKFIFRPFSLKEEDPSISKKKKKTSLDEEIKIGKQEEINHYKKFGIIPIFYDSKNNHNELTRIFEYLSKIPPIKDKFISQPLEYKTP